MMDSSRMFYLASASAMANYWEVWPEMMKSRCFWTNIFAAIHLVFITAVSAQFLYKKIAICRQRCKQDSSDKNSTSETRSGLLYHVTKSCCMIALTCHILLIVLLTVHKSSGPCQPSVSLVLEILQSVSWILQSVAAFSFDRKRCMKLPQVIRAWWICGFFQSVLIVAFDIHLFLADSALIGAAECADAIMLISCTWLFTASVRGNTGVNLVSCAAAEPLLNSSSEHFEAKHYSPYEKSGFIQRITFSWISPLFTTGFKKTLEKSDVPDIAISDSADFLSSSFREILAHVEETHGLSSSSMYRAAYFFIGKKAMVNGCLAVLTASASFVGPLLVTDFVNFLGGDRPNGIKEGYFLALAFLVAKVIETISQRQWIFGARQLGMRLRTALISHIYQKGLRLSCSAKQKHTSGEIINYMSVDIQRVTDVMWYVNYIWMLPIQLSLATFVLHRNLGISAFVALAATIVIMAINIPLTRIQKKLQFKIMGAKDDRMKATSEVLRSMKVLKLQAWDMKYLEKLERLRNVEYGWLWKSARMTALTTFIFWGSPALISSVTFGACLLMGIPLTAGSVLSALATFRMLQDPIFTLPDLLSALAQGKVSADRIASFLEEEELHSNAVITLDRHTVDYDVEIDNGTFSWDNESPVPLLKDIQLKVRRGMKVAICGLVGSGKSSLLSCILGEMPKLTGTVKVSGSKAYIPQSAWIMSGNIRDNILFGNKFNRDKYEATLQACALNKDLELFANGDLTEIGERGINMSGGQKQRIQIARAVYHDADIYLFDDPFSAVDAHTGSQLFKDCLLGLLKDKTVLYVTHQVEFLPDADLILVMRNGRIEQIGNFDELLEHNIGFEAIVGAHSQALESVLTAENCSRVLLSGDKNLNSDDPQVENISTDQVESIKRQESEHDLSQDMNERGRITQEEERERGSIGKKVYWAYLTAVLYGVLPPLTIIAQVFFQIFQVASNYWMAWACPPSETVKPLVDLKVAFLVYVILCVASAFGVLARSLLLSTTGLLTSEKFFKDMLNCIMRAPMSFFDSTPTGRILNRASNDQSVLDLELVYKLGWCGFAVIQIIATISVMSQVAWPVFAIFIPVAVVCLMYQHYYTPTARELARLSEIQRAPILHHFAESLSGAATIRAYEQKGRFSSVNLGLINNHSRPWFHNISAMEWLSFRLNMLSSFVFAFCLIMLVSLPEGFINPSIAGLAVTYSLNLNQQLASIIWNICNTENKMISVERILQYTRIPSEAPLLITNSRPPNNWPVDGAISITALEVRYAEHLPSVLRNISCEIPGRKKVGIVGRTGSGKSTLIQALFRIVEPRQGMITIDHVDISKIGLHDLRSRISTIPQDPTMFDGTVRTNLDPLGVYTDDDIWKVLDKCQLGDLVRHSEMKLESKVVENGENWSMGQRQLFCLGRVLLKRSNILVLDEATASVDSATDATIQETIRREFNDCTVLTIAHRIHTIIDSDLILVFGEGRILEFDTPTKLLENEDSAFSKLIKEYSRRSKSFNRTPSSASCS